MKQHINQIEITCPRQRLRQNAKNLIRVLDQQLRDAHEGVPNGRHQQHEDDVEGPQPSVQVILEGRLRRHAFILQQGVQQPRQNGHENLQHSSGQEPGHHGTQGGALAHHVPKPRDGPLNTVDGHEGGQGHDHGGPEGEDTQEHTDHQCSIRPFLQLGALRINPHNISRVRCQENFERPRVLRAMDLGGNVGRLRGTECHEAPVGSQISRIGPVQPAVHIVALSSNLSLQLVVFRSIGLHCLHLV
mmetsp:Transcript_88997/g.203564  ORF Transcript_88997/g.203564 Transcript_88997/m.203564 type:complete len:245 (+) Transcript_88997:761-1495(+)